MAWFDNILGEIPKTPEESNTPKEYKIDDELLSSIIKSLETSTNEDIKALWKRLKELNIDAVSTEWKQQIEAIFVQIWNMDDQKYWEEIHSLKMYIDSIERLYKKYSQEKWEIIWDSRSKSIFVEWSLSDEIDWGFEPWYGLNPWSETIMQSYETAENLWLEHDKESAETRITSLIVSTKLNRSILDINVMDNYISDLLSNNSLSAEESEKLKAQIELFKSSPLYKSLETWEEISLSNTGDEIDTKAREVKNIADSTPFTITLWENSYTFYNKKECLLALYEWKLHLAYMEPNMLLDLTWWTLGTTIGKITTAVIIWYIWVKIGVKYTKEYLKQKADIINEWVSRSELDKMANASKTWNLDKTIEMYLAAGYEESDIKPLIDLQKKVIAVNIDAGKPDDVLRAKSNVYRHLARMRGRLWWLISSFYPISKPVSLENKPLQWLGSIVVGSVNKWPEWNLAWWQLQTQKEVILKYAEWFWKFNTIMENIDTILKDQYHFNDELRADIRKQILGVYVDWGIPLLRWSRVRLFRDRFDTVQKLLEKNWATLNSDLEIFMRALKWEIDPSIQARLWKIKNQVHAHPGISDADEKKLILELQKWQHANNPAEFDVKMNDLIRKLGISWLVTIWDVEKLDIKPNEIFTLDDLKDITKHTHTDTPNYAKIVKYLQDTTEGHKWIIFYNIARIINGETPLKTLDLDVARGIINGPIPLSWIPTNKVWEFIRWEKDALLNHATSLSTTWSPSKAPTGAVGPSPSPGPASGPSASLDTLKQNAYDFADRAILEAALQWDNHMDNPKFSAQVQTEIRNTLKSSGVIDDAWVRTIIEKLSWKPLPVSIRDIGAIKNDFLARINAKSISDAERLRINGEFMNLKTLPSLRDALKPWKILKMIL